MSVGVRRAGIPDHDDNAYALPQPDRSRVVADQRGFVRLIGSISASILIGVAAYGLQFGLYHTDGGIAYVLVPPFVGASGWLLVPAAGC